MEFPWVTFLFQLLTWIIFPAFVFLLIVGLLRLFHRWMTNMNRIQLGVHGDQVWVVDPSTKILSFYRYNQETNQIEELARKQLP